MNSAGHVSDNTLRGRAQKIVLQFRSVRVNVNAIHEPDEPLSNRYHLCELWKKFEF